MTPSPFTRALCGLAGAFVVVTVDRIEGDQVVVEWSEGTVSALPQHLLPDGLKEGDQLRLRWQRTRRRSPTVPPPSAPLSPDFFLEAPHGAPPPPSSHAPDRVQPEPAC